MTADVEHRQGCPATGGYGHGVEPCICGAATVVELLPLPEWSGVQLIPDSLIRDYARACVEHNVRRRAAVDPLAVLARAQQAEARAERMAEALHRLTDACDDSDGAQYGTLSTTFVRGVCEGGLEENGN